MKASLDDIMRGFARFLDASWNAALAAAGALDGVESTDFMADWAQANWEILVETAFRESVGFGKAYLEFYGEGADCDEASSRVWSPRAIPTHRIRCQTLKSAVMLDLLTGRLVDASEGPVVFDRFAVKSERGWYKEAPPFDCVLGYRGDREVLIALNQVAFVAEEIAEKADTKGGAE